MIPNVFVGKATDVWSFGVTLFEALEGQQPFHGDDVLLQILTKKVPPLQEGTLSEAIRELVSRALTREPFSREVVAPEVVVAAEEREGRFESAVEMQAYVDEHFKQVLAGTAVIVSCNDTQPEAKVVRAILSSALCKARFYFHVPDEIERDPKENLRVLLRQDVEILHFATHGSADSQILLSEGSSLSLPELADLLIGAKGVRCVILDMCNSAVIAQDICRHVSYVIHWDGVRINSSATMFAESFYVHRV